MELEYFSLRIADFKFHTLGMPDWALWNGMWDFRFECEEEEP